jgi:KDO2-lipid IV(A) lauroyltransferase
LVFPTAAAETDRSTSASSATSKTLSDKFVTEYLATHYTTQLSIFLFPKLNRNNVHTIHTFSGLEHLEKALTQTRGAILLHAHFGPAQLTLVALALQGYPMIQIGLPIDEGLSWIGRHVAFRLRLRYESAIPAKIVSADGYLRPVVHGLHRNAVVMTTGDGAGRGKYLGKFITSPFLGRQFPFSAGAVQLSDRLRTPVLPTFLVPVSKTKWRTEIHPPLSLSPQETLNQQMQPFIALLESYVIQYPGLWHFWDELDQRIEYAQQLKS